MDEKGKKTVKKVAKKTATKKSKKVDKELTEKEKLFCLVYINNFNAASAVIKAGYEPKDRINASKMGYELLDKTRISKEITRLKKEKMKTLKISKNDIVERFMRIAFADITDFVEFNNSSVKIKNSTNLDGALITEVKQGLYGNSIKLEDRQKALMWLADYFEMNPMNAHRKKFDIKKLEIEKEKLELTKQQHNPPESEETESDGFLEALKESAEEVWSNEDVAEISEESSI